MCYLTEVMKTAGSNVLELYIPCGSFDWPRKVLKIIHSTLLWLIIIIWTIRSSWRWNHQTTTAKNKFCSRILAAFYGGVGGGGKKEIRKGIGWQRKFYDFYFVKMKLTAPTIWLLFAAASLRRACCRSTNRRVTLSQLRKFSPFFDGHCFQRRKSC